jgi:hypothetical protein
MPVYSQSPSHNDKPYDLPNKNWTAVGPAFKVTKKFDKTPIELEYSGEVLAASISGNGVWFQIRLDNKVPTCFSQGSLKSTELQDEVSAKSIYVGSSAKGILISNKAPQAPGGSANQLLR